MKLFEVRPSSNNDNIIKGAIFNAFTDHNIPFDKGIYELLYNNLVRVYEGTGWRINQIEFYIENTEDENLENCNVYTFRNIIGALTREDLYSTFTEIFDDSDVDFQILDRDPCRRDLLTIKQQF